MDKYAAYLYGDKVPYAVGVQKRILERASQATAANPFIIGHLDHSQTDPSDFARFVEHGADVLVIHSGVILQNMSIRSAINRFTPRPLNLWSMDASGEEQDSNNYLLGEETEAAISGSDGLVIMASKIFVGESEYAIREFSRKINEYHDLDLSVSVLINAAYQTAEYLDLFLGMENKPDVIFWPEQEKEATDDEFLEKYKERASDQGVVLVVARITRQRISFVDEYPEGRAIIVRDPDLLPFKVQRPSLPPLIKVCGIQTIEAAQEALDSGASMIGMILVPGRQRTVSVTQAKAISALVKKYRRTGHASYEYESELYTESVVSKGSSQFDVNARIVRISTMHRPLIVGVFRNQPLEEILHLTTILDLDMVQLHGNEPLNWCRTIPVPVIKRFTPGTPDFQNSALTGHHYLSLIDGEIGGEGKIQDWSALKNMIDIGARFILAGGLDETNVQQALIVQGVIGVDVSGGVETNGVKDLGKINRFVKRAGMMKLKY